MVVQILAPIGSPPHSIPIPGVSKSLLPRGKRIHKYFSIRFYDKKPVMNHAKTNNNPTLSDGWNKY